MFGHQGALGWVIAFSESQGLECRDDDGHLGAIGHSDVGQPNRAAAGGSVVSDIGGGDLKAAAGGLYLCEGGRSQRQGFCLRLYGKRSEALQNEDGQISFSHDFSVP